MTQARSVSEAEALRLVHAGNDLLAGAPIQFAWKNDGVFVKFTLFDGRSKEEWIRWDTERDEPYLVGVCGERWYHLPCVTARGPQGQLVRS